MSQRINEKVFTQFPIMESERLRFVAFELAHQTDLFEIRSNELVMKYMDIAPHQSVDDAAKMIQEVQKNYKDQTGLNWMICLKESRAVIGYFGYWRIDKKNVRGEIGYALKPSFWRKGYMTETLNRMVNFGFKDLSLHSIEANVNPLNHHSKTLLLNQGFQKEAYFRENYFYDGKFLDSEIYCLLASDLTGKAP